MILRYFGCDKIFFIILAFTESFRRGGMISTPVFPVLLVASICESDDDFNNQSLFNKDNEQHIPPV